MTWKSVAKKTLAGIGWQTLKLAGRDPKAPRIAVIMYHSVGAQAPMSFDPTIFEEQLAHLCSIFPDILTVGELAQLTRPIGKWTACLTFDDGYADNHEVILPVLQRHGLHATFFICSGFISGEHNISRTYKSYRGLRQMSWSQIRELSSEGMEIGAHTHSHPLLAALATESQLNEMQRSKQMIEDQTACPVVSFAIPFGNRGTYTRSTLDTAATLFQVCCTTHFSTNPALPRRHSGMLLLDRIEPSPNDSVACFTTKVQGRWDAMKWVQRKRRA